MAVDPGPSQTRIVTVEPMGLLPGDRVATDLWHEPVEVMYRPSRRLLDNGNVLVDVTVRLPWGAYTTCFRPDDIRTVLR